MTVLNFPAVADASPTSLAKILLALPDPGVQARIDASATADLLREAHAEYWEDGRAQTSASAAVAQFTASLHGVAENRKDYWLRLTRYAVQMEMKHWDDEDYIQHSDEPHEVLVNLADYLPTDGDQAEANRDNRDRWADLADTAAHYAVAEGSVELLQAA